MPRHKEPPSPALAELGSLIVAWNGVEHQMRDLLCCLSKDPEFVWWLTVNMSTTDYCDAIRAWAIARGTDAERDHLQHAVRLFEEVRVFRNHYVHDVRGIAESSDDAWTEAVALAHGPSTYREKIRAGYQLTRKPLDVAEMQAARGHCSVLITFLGELSAHFRLASVPFDEMNLARPPLPDKPPLPSTAPTGPSASQ